MYQRSSNQSSGTIGAILILLGSGLALGLALTKSDLANPIKGVADFRRAEVETERVARQNEIDLRQYGVLQEARTQAEIEKLQEEIRYLEQTHEAELQRREDEAFYQRQAHEQELRYSQARESLEMHLLGCSVYASIVALVFVLVSLGIGCSVYIARKISTRARINVDVWTHERKRLAIRAARWRERELRKQELREREPCSPELDLEERLSRLLGSSSGSNGHSESRDSPAQHPSSLRVCD